VKFAAARGVLCGSRLFSSTLSPRARTSPTPQVRASLVYLTLRSLDVALPRVCRADHSTDALCPRAQGGLSHIHYTGGDGISAFSVIKVAASVAVSIADIPAVLFAVVAAQHLQAPQPPPPRPPPPPPPSSLPSSPPSQTPAPPPRSPPPRLPSPSRRRRLLRCHRRRRPHHRLHCRLHCRLHRCEARSRTRCPRNSLWCKCVHARPSPVRGAAFLQVLVRIWRRLGSARRVKCFV
jgi:hypothetical protein